MYYFKDYLKWNDNKPEKGNRRKRKKGLKSWIGTFKKIKEIIGID